MQANLFSEGRGTTIFMSLLSVGVLVALFFYLNRYTRRKYFTIWGAAWLFYGLWLTLKLPAADDLSSSLVSFASLLSIETSAVFLLWGSFRFLGQPTPQALMGLFLAFLYAWSFAAPKFFDNVLLIELPCFSLMGVASATAGISFLRFQEKRRFVGSNLLSLGFLLWSGCLVAYPLIRQTHAQLAGMFFLTAAVQLFIAVSMIILVLEEVRFTNESIISEIESVKIERETLLARIRTSEQQLRTLFADATLKEEAQRAYEDLRTAHRAVVEQERLSVLGQLASGIAHDINNALTPILGFSDLLIENESKTPSQRTESLRHIRDAGRHIEDIVGRIRRFSGRPGKSEPMNVINLNSLVTEVIETFQQRCKERGQREGVVFELAAKLANHLPVIKGSVGELKDALAQLLSNSLDAMPHGGHIEIRTQLTGKEESASRLAEPQDVLLQVCDDGVGMDETTCQRCVEPFFSTKKPRCTGLGLAVVYGTMQRHRGVLRIESNLNVGTKVSLTFPAAGKNERAEGWVQHLEPSAPLHILCVDDEPLIRRLLADVLAMFGQKVELADGGRAGLQAFQSALTEGKPFDVVITDLGMPDVDGRQVVQGVKRISPHTPVVLLTGWATLLEPGDSLMDQATAVLKKPFSMNQLQSVLQRIARSIQQPKPCEVNGQREMSEHGH